MTAEHLWASFALTIAATLLMVIFNDANALMRSYSRMVSCSFLVLTAMTTLPTSSLRSSIVTICFIAYAITLWRSYQERCVPGTVYFAYLFLGIASTQWIQILFMLPVCWILQWRYTLSLTFRHLMASLLAIVTPYWLCAPYLIYKQDHLPITDHLTELATFQGLAQYESITAGQLLTVAFLTLLAIIGTMHFLRNASADKIRTRLIYYSLIWTDIATLALAALQPQHIQEACGIMTVCTSPLIAHFITYTHTKATNISFILITLAAIAITLFHICMPEAMLLTVETL